MEWLWTLSPMVLCAGALLVAVHLKRLATARHALADDLLGMDALSTSLGDVRGELDRLREQADDVASQRGLPDNDVHGSDR